MATESGQKRTGRILRVKQGYNPNSSSMGSIVFELNTMLLGLTTIFGGVAGVLFAAFMQGPGKPPVEASRAQEDEEKEQEDVQIGDEDALR